MLCTLMFFSGCEKVIDFDPGEVTPYVVMVSRPESDSPVNVYLTKSVFFLQSTYYDEYYYNYSKLPYINDASVTLWMSGNTYTGTLKEDDGRYYYQFAAQPQAGDSLYLEAVVPDKEGKVVAGTRIPSMPDVEIIEFKEQDYEGDYKLRIKLKSHEGKEYYSVSIITWGQESVYDSVTGGWMTQVDTTFNNPNYYYFNVNDPIVNEVDVTTALDGDDGSFWGREMLFSNEMFTNGEHEFTLEFADDFYYYPEMMVDDRPIYLVVKKMAPELYRYNKTVMAQNDSDELFGEPVQVYSNISGGIGIFGGSAQKKLLLPTNEQRK